MGRRGTMLCLKIFLSIFVIIQLSACGNTDSPTEPASTADPPAKHVTQLRPESELTPGCYEWPVPDLTLPDKVSYAMSIGVGEPAIDFTLREPDDERVSLLDLLDTRPVVIVFGAFT